MKLTWAALTLLLSLFFFIALAQTAKETAKAKGKAAVGLEDEGKFDEALKLLTEAQQLDPQEIAYPYEMTYCYYSQEQYQKVIDILGKLKDSPDAFDRLYELLGNSYDILNQTDKAIVIYDEGIKKFPKSGVMYLERGSIPLAAKRYGEALNYFEKGIEVDPKFPSNYYRVTLIYCKSDEPMWGMMYGEIFMNLERNSKRTAEISKLLFDTYKSRIKFNSPDNTTISFSKNNIIASGGSGAIKLPYSIIYEPVMAFATISVKEINLNSLDKIRQSFINFYYDKGFDKKFPNVLFEYQRQIVLANQMEAYNHWLLMKGDEDAFNTWQAANKTKWDDFIKWYTANPLKLDDSHRFYRNMY